MRWFGWWRPKNVGLEVDKIELPEHTPAGNQSDEVLRKSEQKLREAIKTKKEVANLLKVNDQFAEAVQQAMRRSRG